MKHFSYIIPLLLLLFFTSCKKQLKKTKVTGTVVDYCEGTPIDNAWVRLRMWEGTTTLVTTTEDEMVTGTDGKFEFKFRAVKREDEGYLIDVMKEGYYENGQLFGLNVTDNLLNKKEHNQVTYKLMPHASVKIHAVNQTPFDDNDQICITYLVTDFTLIPCRTGQTVNDTMAYRLEAAGNCYNLVKYAVTKNNITTQYTDSVLCEAYKTTILTINY